MYIGSSIRLVQRIKNHVYMLSLRKHDNQKLQNAWNKYGAECFKFEIILNCKAEAVLDYERHFIAEFDSVVAGFNMSSEPNAPMKGIKHSPEAIEKIRESKRAMIRTPEMRAKISAALTGRKLSDQHKENIGSSCKGYQHTEETKQKMRSQSQKRDPEYYEKLRASLTGRAKSEEHKKKTGEATRKRSQNPEYLAKLSAAQKAAQTPESLAALAERNRIRMNDPAVRAKISAAMTGRKASPETKAKLSAAHKGKKLSEAQKLLLSEIAKARWARKKAK